MKFIAIIGGGIGGLTVAHELSKFPQFKIDMYEKKAELGGLARSKRDKDGCATEYCWRVFFGFYHNLFEIFQDIPLINNDKKTPNDNLTVYKHENFSDKELPILDRLKAYYTSLYGMASSDERMASLDNLAWWDAIGTKEDSNVFREIGPWLGMDRLKGSYNSVIKVGMEMQILQTYLNPSYKDYVTTQPTNEAIFDHWEKYLKDNKVNIHLNQAVSYIKIKDNAVEFVIINGKMIKAHYYVLNLPVEALDAMIDMNQDLLVGDLKNVKKLKDTCLHMQLSFQVYFNKPISLGEINAFLIVDSPWDLIVVMYDQVYEETNLCKKISLAKGGWSIAACTAYIPGIVYKKPFRECSYEEIKNEIWAQFMNSQSLRKTIKNNNDFDLSKDLIVHWAPMWSTFHYKDNKLYTTEPKFTNNKGSLALRPSFKTLISNMYISTAYIKETIDIFSMEAACIAGRKVAKDIIDREKINNNISITTLSRPLIFAPFRFVDKLFYSLELPNLTLVIFFIIILLLVYVYVIKK